MRSTYWGVPPDGTNTHNTTLLERTMQKNSNCADTLFATKDSKYIIFTRKINDRTYNYDTDCWDTNTLKTKVIKYDLSDDSFKRELKSGQNRLVADTGVAAFFRGFPPRKITGAFSSEKDAVYRQLVEMVVRQEHFRSNANFATVFKKVNRYMSMESFLLLGIKVHGHSVFRNPVSQFPKSVIRFMRESGFEFSNKWESRTDTPEKMKMLGDLCQHIMTNYHDDLEIYRHLHEMVDSWGNRWDQFFTIASSMDEKVRCNYDTVHGFNHDYKSLFDYIVKCVRTEAMSSDDCLQEYFDYLKMNRAIEQLKEVNRLALLGENVKIDDVGFPRHNKVEKYPKALTILHRLVTRNYNVMSKDYDDEKFKSCVDRSYEWADRDYVLIMPKASDCLKNEGTDLNHCVGSYVKSVLEGRTQIGFMRSVSKPDESLVTVEIRSNGIQQVRGYGNRLPTDEEMAWLEKYAKKKNLDYGQKGVERNGKKDMDVSKGRWPKENDEYVDVFPPVKSKETEEKPSELVA